MGGGGGGCAWGGERRGVGGADESGAADEQDLHDERIASVDYDHKPFYDLPPMELDDLKALIRLMDEHELTELELDSDGRRVRLIKGGQQAAPAPTVVTFPTSLPAGGPALAPTAPNASPTAGEGLQAIPSPMVGTFYRSSSPDAEPFIEVGVRVKADSTLCIIEAMKVMNEIKAECEGVLKEVLVGSGESVEYGQILFRIQPAGA